MLSLTLLIGLWSTSCVQMQTNTNQGFAKELYKIEASGDYTFTREWFSDNTCSALKAIDESRGTIVLKNRLSGMFINGETYAADFTDEQGTDLGAVQVTTQSLKFARGMKGSSMRNTMVGIFEYVKQD